MIRARIPPSLLVASVLALSAGLWTVVASTSALRVELPAAHAASVVTRPPVPTQLTARADTTDDALLTAAIAADPFRPERRPASSRYGAATPDGGADSLLTPPPRALLRLLGTVVDPDGHSFAMCQIGDAPPRAVRVGDRVGEYRLRAVRQGAADFVGPDGPITLRVATPAP